MRIATYTHRGTQSYGVVTPSGIVDLGKRSAFNYEGVSIIIYNMPR